MTQEEIIQLAMEYGFTGGFDADGNLTFDAAFVEAVAEAVAKTRKATLEEMIYEHPTIAIKKAVEYEREACIVDIQMHIPRSGRDTFEYKMAMRMIERIKARGEA